jgi:hypothetical protein
MRQRKRTGWLWLCGALIVALPSTAWANRFQTFLGWSSDGSVYAYETTNDETAESDVIVCWSDPHATSGSWPNGLQRPPAGEPCARGEGLAAVQKVVQRPHAAATGPNGERLSVRKGNGTQGVVVTTGGTQIVIAEIEADDPLIAGRGAKAHTLTIGHAFWRPDGKAVACEVTGHGQRVFVSPLAGASAAARTGSTGGWGDDFAGLRVVADAKAIDGSPARHARDLLTRLATAHDRNCDPVDAKQGRILGLDAEIVPGAGTQTVLASLGDGLAIFDAKGALVASTGDNFGCTYGGSSQDLLQRVSLAQLVPDAEPEIVVQYTTGGRDEWAQNVQVLKRRGTSLVPVFAAIVSESSDGKVSRGTLAVDGNGAIRYKAPAGQPRTFTWSASKLRFAP